MSLIGAIRWTTLRVLQPNNGLVLKHSNQLQMNGSNHWIRLFGKTSQEMANKLPERPKRPQSGYNFFYKDMSATIRTQNPLIKVKDLAKSVAIEWKQLDPMAKQELLDRSNRGKEEYMQEIQKWKNSLNDKQKENYLLDLKLRRRVLAKRRLKSELKRLKYPSRAKTAFNIFIGEEMSKRQSTGEQTAQVFKNVVLKWKTLSAEEKKPFEETAQLDKMRFFDEMDVWKKYFAKQENKEVVERLTKLRSQASKAVQKAIPKTSKAVKKAVPKSSKSVKKSVKKTKRVAKKKAKKVLKE